MPGGYYKRGWQGGLELLDEFWFHSTNYFWKTHDGFPWTLPPNYEQMTDQLVSFVREVAEQDPTPLWDVGRLITEHAQRGKVLGERFPVTTHEVWNAIDRAVILKEFLFSKGTTDKGPGREKLTATKDAERLIRKGLDNAAVADRTGLSVANIRTIRSRM